MLRTSHSRRSVPVRTRNLFRATSALLAALFVLAPGCGTDSGESSEGRTLEVPGDYETIQAAVDASKPGDLVLVGPGVYKETVSIETKNLVLRGTDRNEVIIDGEFTRENGVFVRSDGVAIENLTVRNNTQNGVFFTGDYATDFVLTGYRASYVTAYNNGSYGIYAFNAKKGVFDHDYGSGHPDSAYYVGQCNPCDSLLTDVVSENNMLGYSGTNSTGVTIVESEFRNNRAGIVPNSGYGEELYPNRGTTMVGNLVEDNNSATAPSNPGIAVAYGNGIVFGGVSNNLAEKNLVRDHKNAGIVITDLPDTKNPKTGKQETFKPENNKVIQNTLSGNTIDLAYLTLNYASAPFGNCFADNSPASTFPENLEKDMPCEGTAKEDLGDLSGILSRLTPPTPDVDYKKVAPPPDQPNMPDAKTAPAVPASEVDTSVDLDSITTPTG